MGRRASLPRPRSPEERPSRPHRPRHRHPNRGGDHPPDRRRHPPLTNDLNGSPSYTTDPDLTLFGASARPDGPAGPALPGSARLGVPRPFRRGHMLVMAGGAPEAVRPARGPRRRFKGEGDRRRHPRRRSKAESMTRPGLQAVAVLGVATVRGGPWWTSVGYSRAAADARNRHLLAPNAFVVPPRGPCGGLSAQYREA